MNSHTHDVYASYSRYVTANNVVVRKKASNKGKIVGSYKKAAKVRCYKKKGSYTKIKYGRHYRYIATRYLSKKKPVVVTAQKATNITTDTYTRYVTASSLTIRKKASTSAAKAGSYKKGTQITCYGERSGWTTVRYSGLYCYVSSQYLSESKPEEDTWAVYGTATGQSVVDYAMQFRGNPYVWGGESLTNGVDCSGFTMQVYKHFGYSLPQYPQSLLPNFSANCPANVAVPIKCSLIVCSLSPSLCAIYFILSSFFFHFLHTRQKPHVKT